MTGLTARTPRSYLALSAAPELDRLDDRSPAPAPIVALRGSYGVTGHSSGPLSRRIAAAAPAEPWKPAWLRHLPAKDLSGALR